MSDNDLPSPTTPQQFESQMLIKAQNYRNQKPDTGFELVEAPMDPSAVCGLCQRKDDPLVGPFRKGSVEFYFHQDCVEINLYSFYKVAEKKWVNIESMVKHLVTDAQYTCWRCDGRGASISCITCGRNFHGHKCAKLFMIPLGHMEPTKGNEGLNQS